ncbi:hypothetical protein L0664_17330 [Octadecabacter sp. G9-8]|uniref:NYN domain-containing protein n=1 Tax=Octadecabacter dasysiphoniae TaxID=2909341 RepID=A0ABS9D076_9RHOB|nr:hypothetical protein [Octadecabacter dasysiphoniae]MCF2872833.1 hypothetical protein [Octadecabacter dasysiphoniae]
MANHRPVQAALIDADNVRTKPALRCAYGGWRPLGGVGPMIRPTKTAVR